MKKNKIIFFLLFLYTTNAFGMEEKTDFKTIQLSKISSSALISFLEARMAGGTFCVDPDTKTVTFKHYKKEKNFTLLFNDIKTLELVHCEQLPQQAALNFFYKEYRVLPSEGKRYMKKKVLERQLKRFNAFNNDPLYILFKECSQSPHYLLKKCEDISDEQLESYPAFAKGIIDDIQYRKFIIELEQHLLALEKTAMESDIRYYPGHIKFFEILKKISAHGKEKPEHSTRRNFRQSILERYRRALTSERAEIDKNLMCINEQYENRLAMEEALANQDVKKFIEASWKRTHVSYEPLKENLPSGYNVLLEHFKNISEYISFLDAVFCGGNFKIIGNELEFQHFKKNHKSFRVNPNVLSPFDDEYFSDTLTLLIQSIHAKKSHNDYLTLLSLLSPNQKKAVICFKEVLTYVNNANNRFNSSTSESLLEKLSMMDPYEKMNLAGFDITQQNDDHYCSAYAQKLIEIQENFDEMRTIAKDDLQSFVSICRKPLAAAYIPFKERLKHHEEEISQLKK